MTKEELLPFCECGECGLRVTKKGNRFILGHNNRGVPRSSEHCAAISAAKLGKPRTSPAQIAADEAESKRRRGVSLSSEHNAAVSAAKLGVPHTSEAHLAADEAKRGVPLSPEHCAAISESSLNSNAVKANCKRMKGGNDLVTHHYIYDESDLSKNTVQMTRSDHMKLHNLLRKLGYIIPHINIPDEQDKETFKVLQPKGL